MIRSKWIIGMRNKLSSLWMECDSCAAEDSKLTSKEREDLQKMLKKAIQYIDKRIAIKT